MKGPIKDFKTKMCIFFTYVCFDNKSRNFKEKILIDEVKYI